MSRRVLSYLILLLAGYQNAAAVPLSASSATTIETKDGPAVCGMYEGSVVYGWINGAEFYPYSIRLKIYKNQLKNARPNRVKSLKRKIARVNRMMRACKKAFPDGIIITNVNPTPIPTPLPNLEVFYSCRAEGYSHRCTFIDGLKFCSEVLVDGLAVEPSRAAAEAEAQKRCSERMIFNIVVLDHDLFIPCHLVACAVIN